MTHSTDVRDMSTLNVDISLTSVLWGKSNSATNFVAELLFLDMSVIVQVAEAIKGEKCGKQVLIQYSRIPLIATRCGHH